MPCSMACMLGAMQISLPQYAGRAVAGQREVYDIATKFGITSDAFSSAYSVSSHPFLPKSKIRAACLPLTHTALAVPAISNEEAVALQGMTVKGSREYVRSAVEGSLERLNIKHIDLYYQVDTLSSVRPW